MIKKLGIFALLALIVIPAGVLATGMQGTGAGSQAGSGKALQFQQAAESQGAQGPLMFSSRNGIAISDEKGNGDLLRIRSQNQVHAGDQLQNQTRSQVHAGDQLQSRIRTQVQIGGSLQTVTGASDQLQMRDKLQTMTRLRSQLRDGSCGTCGNQTPTA
jgi:hypothetical protein